MGQLGDLSPEGSIAVGIVVGLLSTSIQSLGLTLQRKSHLLEDDKENPDTRRPPYKRRRWQLGMFMFVISNLVGSTIQITTLPLPVLSTLQASGLVFNTAFATLLLKEPFTRFSLLGTVLTCGGAALIATFGAIGEPAHSLEQLLGLMYRRPFVVWMACTILVVVGTIVSAHVLKVYSSHQHLTRHLQKSERPRSSSQPGRRMRSFSAQLPKPLQLRLGRMRLIRGLSYALISGILSAHSLLVAKSAVELLVRTIVDHNNQFNRFQSWLILLALVFFALSQLYYLHLGLRLCSTSVLYPFVFCIYNIIAILDGLIYFHQTSRLTPIRGGLIGLGTFILLSGVLALSWRLDDTTPVDPAPELLPQTPLTPGMGFIRSSEDGEREPLLPTTRPPNIRTSFSGSENEERTPLMPSRRSRTSLSGYPRTPGSATRDIWAQLDDDDDENDYLTSLTRSPSLHIPEDRLKISKQRKRGSSLSNNLSSAKDQERRSFSPSTARYPRRSQTLQAQRRSSVDAVIPGRRSQPIRHHTRAQTHAPISDEESAVATNDRPRQSTSRTRVQFRDSDDDEYIPSTQHRNNNSDVRTPVRWSRQTSPAGSPANRKNDDGAD